MQAPGTVSRRMAEFRRGSREAAAELVNLFYPQLRAMAGRLLRRERAGHTWQPTALANELYLELMKMKALKQKSALELSREENDRAEQAAFLGFAAHVMKRLLIVHARPLHKRAEKVEIDTDFNLPARISTDADTAHEVEAALSGLAQVDPQLRLIVEWRIGEGLTMEEIAARLNCSERTAARRWEFARHWLGKRFFADRPS